ncbi:MFS transporter [Porticoccaceae bacterium]|nr:MFS transporter [Porticoccaceae bacterium]
MIASQYMAYIAPSMVLAFLFTPLGILQGIYAKHFGVALTTIATVLLISRLFDAVTDPLVGYWSDRYHSKFGSRKPFVLAGGLLFIVSSYFLYVPVDPNQLNAATVVSSTYFLGWFLMLYLAWTLLEIPHLAWGAELAASSQEKNKIYSLRVFSGYFGILLFYLIPFLPFFVDNTFTPQTLQWAAIVAGLLMLPALYLCVKLAPDGAHIPSQEDKPASLWALRNEILANKPFLFFITAMAMYGMAGGLWSTLMFIFIDTYLGLGQHFALLSLIGICSSLLTLGFWYWLTNRLGKKSTWMLGVLLYITGVLGAGILEPGKTNMVVLAIVMILVYVGPAPVAAVSPSLLADIIDYHTWKFGTDRTATYFSLYTLSLKTFFAIGGAVGVGLAGWYGFESTAAVQTEEAVFGLCLAACWLSALLMLLAILVMALVPMSTHRQGIVRRRLDARLERQSTSCKPHITDSATLALETMPS